MKVKLLTGKTVEAKYIAFYVKPMWHGYISVTSDSLSNDGRDLPCLCNNIWCPILDLDTGEIVNWKKGCSADILIEHTDACYASLLDADKKLLGRSENENFYVGNDSGMKDPYYYFAFKWSVKSNKKIEKWSRLKYLVSSDEWDEVEEDTEEEIS